ncbi:FAD:protein FMN transferase [Roseovarius salis]|uniref:FAD:protein FMN transferase n=1 Tax=Roseovarius salis TaxID=3376063 RepID=UPI0037CCB28F
MQTLSRRRFLAIAACTAVFGTRSAAAPELTQWRSTALGARTTLSLAHPEAASIAESVFAELRRLEDIFSLYRPGSSLSRLNRDGKLAAPPFELLDCLSLCARIHAASDGMFDPTVQPLWAAYARYHAGTPGPAGIETARALVGWHGVSFDSGAVRFDRSGMAVTLNGIAQGYIADRIAGLLRREGLTDVMVDTGELHALGGHPDGGAWPVTLETVGGTPAGSTHLRDAAMATSAPAGTRFGDRAQAGHILDPAAGRPARARWRLVSVTGPSAALGDGLSTAACLMQDQEAITSAVARFPSMSLAHLS